MKRRFALPVSIALALHATLFLGSSDPRIDSPVTPKPKLVESDKPDPEKELARQVELASDSASDCGGIPVDESDQNDHLIKPPPGIPDPDLPPDIDLRPGIRQPKVKVTGGDGTEPGTWAPRSLRKGDGNNLIGTHDLDRPPHTRYQKSPTYPRSMRLSGTDGTVWVDFVVDERGRANNVRVLKSTHREFEEATIAAVSEWRFEPGTRKGLPVRFRMSVPILFSLNN